MNVTTSPSILFHSCRALESLSMMDARWFSPLECQVVRFLGNKQTSNQNLLLNSSGAPPILPSSIVVH